MLNSIFNAIDFDLQKAVLDNYQLKEGLYVRVGEDIEFFIYKPPKRQGRENKEIYLKDLSGNIKADEYEWFVKRDYLSGYLNSNKAIDPPKKKIHSNNYLALFVKATEFIPENKQHFIEKLFDNLKTFDSFSKKQEKEVLKQYENYIYNEERQENVERKKELFLKYFDEIVSVIKEKEIKNYVKIFFDEPIDKYKKESEIYYALKIYNKIETVREIEGKIYGLSDFNMGLNQKKPYLEHKTRGCEYPFLVSKDDVFKIKMFFDYLKYQDNLLNFDGKVKDKKPTIFITKHSNNDRAEITDFDIIVRKEESIDITVTNHTLTKNGGGYVEKRHFRKRGEFLAFLDEVFYNKQLLKNFYGEPYSKLNPKLLNLIYLTRDLIKNYLKGDENAIFVLVKKYGEKFLEYHLKNSLLNGAIVLNTVISLKGMDMNIEEKLKELKELIKNPTELSSDDFYLLSGQVIRYLLNKSKASNKNADMIEPFLRVNRASQLKKEIEALFFKYKHEIPLNFQKFNNALALIEAYEENEKVQKDKLMVGILSENIFYERDEK